MAYWFGLYLPTDSGIVSATVKNSAGTTLESGIQPAGTANMAWQKSGVTTGLTITPTLESGVVVSEWIINVDGSRYYQYTDSCTVGYIESATNIQVKLETYRQPSTLWLEFNANGGSGEPNPVGPFDVVNNYASGVTIPDSVPTRSGYTFLGWSLNDEATEPGYYRGVTYNNWWAGSGTTITQTLYAVWQKTSTVTIYFNANGGSNAPGYIGPYTVTNGYASGVTIPSSKPTRNGYTFLGWSLSDDATEPGYYAGVTYNNWWAGSGTTITQTLYAVWTKQASVGGVYLGNGIGFSHYTPYIWNNGWKKAVPYIWNNGWKKGV